MSAALIYLALVVVLALVTMLAGRLRARWRNRGDAAWAASFAKQQGLGFAGKLEQGRLANHPGFDFEKAAAARKRADAHARQARKLATARAVHPTRRVPPAAAAPLRKVRG